jgi:NAD(P)-dependent dehydrogenase (short-subunit alcohol dehydrogenase family)
MVDDQPHKGEIALVTGGNKGIGEALVRRLAAEGLTVYLGARDPARGHEAAERIAASGADVRFVALDVTDEAQVSAAVARIDAEAGRLDVLVNNAATNASRVAPADVTVDDVRRTFDVNVFGVVTVTRACLPLLRRTPGARIVNLSSPLGSLGMLADPDSPVAGAAMLAYSSSKAALNALTLLYANALRDEKILVNAVNPGFVMTDMTGGRGFLTADDGAEAPVRLALLGPDGPTGTFSGRPADFTDDSIRHLTDATLPW